MMTSLCIEGHFAIVISYICALVYMKQPQVRAPYLTLLHSHNDDYQLSVSVRLLNCQEIYLWKTVKIMYLNRLYNCWHEAGTTWFYNKTEAGP